MVNKLKIVNKIKNDEYGHPIQHNQDCKYCHTLYIVKKAYMVYIVNWSSCFMWLIGEKQETKQ